MSKVRRSSKEWFKIWDRIMYLEDTLSRVSLSKISGASVWIIKSLQTDWMMQNDVTYERARFSHDGPKRNLSLQSYIPPTGRE